MQLPEIKKYTEYLFKVALKKCGDINDAEDLTQEVLLAAFEYPKEIANVKPWLSMVLNHKYYDMLRRRYKLPTVSIDLIAEEAFPEDYQSRDDRPDAVAVRREVAYLAEKYRTVIVRHYLNGEKVQDIADSLGVPKGTVLSRLSGGREQMKKGLTEMELYEKQSYQPERLDIGCNGSQGFHGEPWSLVANDLMKQNILITAYRKPLTTVEISRALGIPTAYVESAVRDLTASELMVQTGNKYFTDFMIVKPEQVLSGLDAEIALVESHYEDISNMVKDYLKELEMPFLSRFGSESFGNEKRKKLNYFFVLHLFSTAIYQATQRIVPAKEEYPQRPDGGRWIAKGTQYPENFDFEGYLFGKYCYGGVRDAYCEGYLNAKSIDLKIYDTQPELNRYQHGPVEIDDGELAKLLYIIDLGIPIEATGFNAMLFTDIPHLIDCGVLGERNGHPFVNVPIITPSEYHILDKIRSRKATEMADLIEPWLREIFPKLKIDIPGHLKGRIAEFRQYSCYAIPMAFIRKAISENDFDDANATPPMVFVVDDSNKRNYL